MKSFIIRTTGITLALLLIGGLVFSLLIPQYYLPILPFLLLFFYITTLVIHAYHLKLAKQSIGKFTSGSMLINVLKLLLYSVVSIAYIAFDSSNAIPFVVCLMLLYIIFTFLEVSNAARISGSSKN